MPSFSRHEQKAPSGHITRGGIARRLVVVSAASLYALLLQIVYVVVISPSFAYAGYVVRGLPDLVLILNSGIAILPALWLPVRLTRPSQLVYWILYVAAFVPSVVVPQYALTMPATEVLGFSLALFVAFVSLGFIYLIPLLKLRRFRIRRRLFWRGIGVLSVGSLAIVFSAFGFPKALPSLSAIYEVRETYIIGLTAGGRTVGLAITLLANIIGPLLMAVGLVGRRWRVLAAGLGIELIVFATTGFKSALLAPMAVLAVYVVIRFAARSFGVVLSLGMLLLVGITWAVDSLMNQVFLVSWLIRRFLVTPGLAAGRFFEYFSEHGFAQLGHSVLARFVDSPYDTTPPFVIGFAYEGREFSANANVWADGFANYGVLGMMAATVIVALVLHGIDSVVGSQGLKQKEVVTLLLILPGITFSNSAVLTSLATHGVIVIFLVAFLLPRDLLRPKPRRASTVTRVEPGSKARAGALLGAQRG